MAYTLTMSGWKQYNAYDLPKVNGVQKIDSDSPITLNNGDVIEVPTSRGATINGTKYSTGETTTLNLADQDIALVSGNVPELSGGTYVTINYTISGGGAIK